MYSKLNDCLKGTTWDMGAYEYTARVGTNDVNTVNNLKIYPNPATHNVVLEDIKPNALVELYDVLGKKVISQKAAGGQVNVDISGLHKGIYFCKIMNSDNILQIGNFVKE